MRFPNFPDNAESQSQIAFGCLNNQLDHNGSLKSDNVPALPDFQSALQALSKIQLFVHIK